MQNFTFGRKGINWFLFAFILFVGSLSSYGQCYTVDDEDLTTSENEQSYCYLQTIQDLINSGVADSDGDTEIYESADTVNDTDPYDRNELLTDGTIYYVGSSSGSSCSRVPVELTVNAQDTPRNNITSGRGDFTISPCESSGFTAQNLEDLFNADSGYVLEVYNTEFGSTAMDPTTLLDSGDSYFVGQVPVAASPATPCPSTRAAVGFDPISAPAPNTEDQTFCEGATVGDLVAEGTEDNTQAIRWYRNRNSNTPLADNVKLINGEDYFAAQIVNDRNDPFPPCETTMADRERVVVTLISFDAGPDASATLCKGEVDSRLAGGESPGQIFLSLVDDRSLPNEVRFDPPMDEIGASYNSNPYQTFTTTAIFTTQEGCSDDVEISITVEDTFNAGADNLDNIICRDELSLPASEDAIRAYLKTLLSSDADRDGTFSNVSSIRSRINAGDSGPFFSTYTVGEGSACEDTADFSAEIIDPSTAKAGKFDSFTVSCTNQDPIDLTELENNNSDATPGGEFSGTGVTNNVFDPSVGPGTYTITYSVDDSLPCVTGTDSSDFDIVVEGEGGNAGADNLDNIICRDELSLPASEDAIRAYLKTLLSSDADRDGTFSNVSSIRSRINAGESGPFFSTYTVGEGSACEDTADFSAEIVDSTNANAGSFNNIEDVCSDEDPIDLTNLTNNNAEATNGGTFSGTGVTDNQFDPSVGAGTYTITYTVDDSTPCTTGTDSTTFTITVEEAPVSGSINETLCVTDANDLIGNLNEGVAYISGLLNTAGVDDVDTNNFGANAIAEATALLNYVQNPSSDSETFNFTYNDPSSTICPDGVITIAITITNEKEAEAGTIEDQRVCESSGMIDLTDFYGEDTVPGGTFSGSGVSDNMFDSSVGPNADGYVITYTIDDSAECVKAGSSDSTTFTITVDGAVTAGNPNSADICRANIGKLFPNNTSVKKFYLDLLESGVARNGTFNPTIQQLIDDYSSNPDQDEFTTEYTVTNGSCNASVTLTINIFDAIPAEIEEIDDPDPICQNADDLNLFDFLSDDANTNGKFEGYEDGIFRPSTLDPGPYTITYILDETSECTEGVASEDFTITVTESAFAGMDKTIPETCKSAAEIDLTVYTADGDADGEFTFQTTGEVIADGILDPSTLTEGDYVIVYTVPATNDCGEDTAELSLTISDAPDAPVVDGDPFTFCATDMPIGSDLSATGTNLTFYSDADLTMMVMDEDALIGGTYYVTQRADEAGCESEATAFTVTVNDAATPTISNSTLTFCEYDDATIGDLTAELNETGTITWYDSADGDNALSSGTALQNGVYYATLFNSDSGCESSNRLAVTVNIESCPLLFPEGFSPNGDGLNDTFDIKNIEREYPNYTIEIRNRFGDLVYKGNASTPDWDGYSSEGSFGSDVLPVGAYFYYINFNDGSTKPRRGTVYLSR